jgi:hypothetical protein
MNKQIPSESPQEKTRRLLEQMYGKGTTPQSLLSFGQAMSRPLSRSQKKAIKAELACEDAMAEQEQSPMGPCEEAQLELARSLRKNRRKKK